MTKLQQTGKTPAAAGLPSMRYRLALDLGAKSLGWAMIRLDADGQPCAIIRAGVRIFSDGRRPKDGTSLAEQRRLARAMRRRRDRLLRRKARVRRLLVEHGFFPKDPAEQRLLERLNPYELRARGLDEVLTGPEFARALFHLNQRRGFKSNRRTDRATEDKQMGPLKAAIADGRSAIDAAGDGGRARTVGEWLWRRMREGLPVRARFRELRVQQADNRTRKTTQYDLSIDRAMVEAEFDQLWHAQARMEPALCSEAARTAIKDALLYQRKLHPVTPGRCTFLPEEARAALALPSTQRFRLYQEVNNLRVLDADLHERSLTIDERDRVIEALETHIKRTFTALKKLLRLPASSQFNLEDVKRVELRGNITSALLSKPDLFGDQWFHYPPDDQDRIVEHLLTEESETVLIDWLITHTGVDAQRAKAVAAVTLPAGYGHLSVAAIRRILPFLRHSVTSFAAAAREAGFHHSVLSENEAVDGRTVPIELINTTTGEVRTWHVCRQLPYYGEVLGRHVAFGSGKPEDPAEIRYGRIANPTVHIGLHQVQVVVNALLKRYGHPREVVVEVARELKQSWEQRREDQQRQADAQKRNDRLRADVASVFGLPHRVTSADIQKLILWEELSGDVLDRRCPYSGERLSMAMVLSDQVEVDHILPFSRTLDDSLNNKTLAIRGANRLKGNRTPWEARHDFEAQGWSDEGMALRAGRMPKQKRYRFAENGYQRWLQEDKDFLARALNDTRYLSRVALEYVRLTCPQDTRVIPGRMTAMLRARFGLNSVLGVTGDKNRDDHRHHAVDACVIGVTDHALLKRFADASASAKEHRLDRLVESMPLPWPSYRAHVERAVTHLWVSHRPDHSYQGAMHNDTAYSLRAEGRVAWHAYVDGRRERYEDRLTVIPITHAVHHARHGTLPDGTPRPYKGYKGDSNYCMEIVRGPKGRWLGRLVTTFEAYQAVRRSHGDAAVLRHPTRSLTGESLVMRLMKNDMVRLELDGETHTMRVVAIGANIILAELHEANADARNRDKDHAFRYTYKTADTLRQARGRRVTVSPIGDLTESGFRTD